jgi:hypothetical protein
MEVVLKVLTLVFICWHEHARFMLAYACINSATVGIFLDPPFSPHSSAFKILF